MRHNIAFRLGIGFCLGLALTAGLSAQQIAYTVTGTFASPVNSGTDPLGLAGNPFTANFKVLAQNLPASTSPFSSKTYAVVAGSATLTLTGTGFSGQTVTCGASPAPGMTLSNVPTGGVSYTLTNCTGTITFQGNQQQLNITQANLGWYMFQPPFQYAIPLQILTPQTVAVAIKGATASFNYNLNGGAVTQLAYTPNSGQISAPCQASGGNPCPSVTIPKTVRLTDTNVHTEPLQSSGSQLDYEFIVSYPTSPTACIANWLTATPATGFGQTYATGKPGTALKLQATNLGVSGSYCATVAVYTPNNSSTIPSVINVTYAPPPTITTTSLPNGSVGAAYSAALSATGGTPPYVTWAVSSGALPPGLSLNASTGVISGTPTSGGTYTPSFTVTDSANVTSQPKALSITVTAGPIITTSSLPNAEVNIAYSQTLAATGGVPPYGNWQLASGALPPGMTLNASTGVISGTASATGASSFSVTVSDSMGVTSPPAALSITVVGGPTITTSSLPNGEILAHYSQTLAVSGGLSPYTWTLTGGKLPSGLSLNSSTGVISGTPSNTGTSSFTVTAKDSAGITSPPASLSITVVFLPSITTSSLPLGEVGIPYSQTLSATGGIPPYSNWTVVANSGFLPPGLTLNASTGVISGTPAIDGNSSFSVTVSDSVGGKSSAKPFAMTMVTPPVVTTTSLPTGSVGVPYSQALAASGGVPPYGNWTVSVGSLPAGLSLNASTGVISGTPRTAGTSSFSVTVQDSLGGVSAAKALSLTIISGPIITTNSLPNGEVGAVYSQTLTAAGGTPPYSNWTVSSGTLPAGLSLNASTGEITGTPTTAGTQTVSFTVKDNTGAVSPAKQLSITIIAGPTVTTSSLPNGEVNLAYSLNLAATGGTPPYSNWTLSNGALPAGMSLNASTGVLGGTPTASGSFSFSVTVNDSAGATSPPKSLSLTIVAAVTITTTSLPNGSVGVTYLQTLTASGGVSPYSSWTVTSGKLPTGLTLISSTGTITGKPTTNGVYAFTVTVTDSLGAVSPPASLSITIGSGPTITTSSLPNGEVNVAYSQTLAATGGVPPYSNWTVTTGLLPAGLSLNSSTGVISGTPSATGTSTFSVTVKDSAGSTSPAKALSIVVVASPSITTNSLPNGTVGVTYSQTLGATGGIPPYSNWTVSSGSLPAGLTLNAATGVISGTPTGTGTSSFSVTVADSVGGVSPAKALSITISTDLIISSGTLPNGEVGLAYSTNLTASGGVPPYSNWLVTSGALPGGLSLNASSGAITGTPNAAGTFNFSATVQDSTGATSPSKALSIIITAGPTVTTTSLPNGDVNVAYSRTLAATGGVPPYSNFTVSSGSLPSGFSLNASTGVISGMASATGASSFSVTVKDSAGATSPPVSLSITIVTGPSVTTTSLPNGTVGSSYSQTLAASGGVPPYSNWTVSGGSLPAGLSLNASTGVISGTPSTVGASTFSVTVADSAGGVSSPQSLSITIATNLIITTTSLPNGEVGIAYSQTLGASGGNPPYSNWTVSSGSLPAGLSLNASTGTISGTPTTAGPSSFSVTVKDNAGNTSPAQPLTITIVSPPVITTNSLPGGTINVTYSQTLTASGGTPPYSNWVVTSGSLPPGLTLNASSGTISGTPTTATGSPFSFSVTVTDSASLTSAPKALSIVITTTGYIFSTLHTFTGGAADGATPFATPILSNGALIGTTQGGGASNAGTVYSLNVSSGSYSVIHSFLGAPADGGSPVAGVVVGSNGSLYGATSFGGGLNDGAAYSLTLGGAAALLHSFAGPPAEGINPTGTPAFDGSGNLYGTTYQGGANSAGTVYEITAGGVYSTVTSFTTTQGPPRAGLTYYSGQFYGTTTGNGKVNSAGTVFQVGKSTPLYTFTGGPDGAQPQGGVTPDGHGYLYGTASGGGSASLGLGSGVIFKVNISTGVQTTLYTFAGTDGATPMSGLAVDSSGNWYGTTYYGGASGSGTVFKLDTTGKLTTLYSFTGGADGGSPNAGVVVDSSGNVYGITTHGGSGYGTIFVLTPVGH